MIELMQSIDLLLTEPWLQKLALSLAVKSTFVLGVAGLAVGLVRRGNAAVRSYILSLSLVVTLLLPLLIYVTPHWQFPGFGVFSSAAPGVVPTVGNSSLQTFGRVPDNNFSVSVSTLLIAIWLLGTTVLLIRLSLGWYLMLRISRRSRATDNLQLAILTERIAGDLEIRRSVKLIFSSEVLAPMTSGIWDPKIVLPERARAWPRNTLEMSLTHELAHVKRRDTLWYLVGSVAAALYWFNPLVWWCRKRLVAESEFVCDDYVLLLGGEATVYAEELLSIARHVGRRRFALPVGAGMTRKSELEGRLMSILSDRKRAFGLNGLFVTIGIALTIALVAPLSGVQLQAVETDQKSKAADAAVVSSGETSKTVRPVLKAGDGYPSPDEFVPVTSYPELISSEEPEYPRDAKRFKIEGVVKLNLLVDTEGTVKEVRVQESSGSKLLDLSATKAAYATRYTPAMHNGKPVAVWIGHKLTFSLANDNYPTPNEFVPVTSYPEMISLVEPEYPAEAKKNNIEGDVWLQALVDVDGSVVKARVAKTSGHELLDSAALESAYLYKYTPATNDGKPVATWVGYHLSFRLDNQKESGK